MGKLTPRNLQGLPFAECGSVRKEAQTCCRVRASASRHRPGNLDEVRVDSRYSAPALNTPLAVVVDLGEVGPSNTNSFVKLSVPLKLRSNVAYQLNMVSSVAGAGATAFSLKDTDVGFGLTPAARPANLAAGVDTNATPGDPTVGGSTDANGRWVYAGANSTLGAYAVSGAVLSGPRVNQAVSASSNTSLTFPAIFAVKPQFYDPAPAITITAQFTVVAL